MIALDPYGLEGTLGRVSARGPYSGRDRVLYDLRQLSRGLNGMLLPLSYNMLCYILRKIILTIVPDDPVQFHFSVSIDNVSRRGGIPLIHPHVQRRILPVGKSPGSLVQLIGGNSQIQVDTVHFAELQILQHCFDILIIASYYGYFILKVFQPLSRGRYGVRILVNANETSASQAFAHLVGMSSPAQRSIHINASGLDIQASHCLI